MNPIDKLTEYFTQFPGIGERQARRFVYYLLSRPSRYLDDLAHLLQQLQQQVSQCGLCYRYFVSADAQTSQYCDICSDTSRDGSQLMVVAREADVEAVEHSGTYQGRYFVLGGTIPVLAQHPEKLIRSTELLAVVRQRDGESALREVILALPANPDGDNTADHLAELLQPLATEHGFRVSKLGRGISTGLELEYSDAETLKNALQNRQ